MAAIVLRIALVIGACIDLFVAVLALFAQQLLGPLLDIPVKDATLTAIAGGEFAVVGLLYVVILRDIERFRPLLWLVALDQLFAALIPGAAIVRGDLIGTWKTVGPIPVNVILCAIFVWQAARR